MSDLLDEFLNPRPPMPADDEIVENFESGDITYGLVRKYNEATGEWIGRPWGWNHSTFEGMTPLESVNYAIQTKTPLPPVSVPKGAVL